MAKNLLLEKMHNQSIVVPVDSQAAIKALIKFTEGKQNHVSIFWIPGHAGAHGNEVANHVAKSESK